MDIGLNKNLLAFLLVELLYCGVGRDAGDDYLPITESEHMQSQFGHLIRHDLSVDPRCVTC